MKVLTYGTLRPTLSPQNVERFKLTPLGPATMTGNFELVGVSWFPALIPSEQSRTIIGEAVEVENLKGLDFYESFSENGNGLYDRKEVPIVIDGQEVSAWVYFMKARPTNAKTIESNDWANK